MQGSPSDGSHLAEYAIELSPGEVRPISAVEIAQRWREMTDPIFGAKEMVFTTDLFSAGDAINLQLTSRSLNDLNSASTLLKERLSRYPGVIDIKDSFAVGKRRNINQTSSKLSQLRHYNDRYCLTGSASLLWS